MTTLLTTLKITGAAGAIAVGSTIFGVSDAFIGPDTHIPLSVVVAIVSVGVGSAFTIARVITRWEDRLSAFEKRMDSLRCMECKDSPPPSGTQRFRHPKP